MQVQNVLPVNLASSFRGVKQVPYRYFDIVQKFNKAGRAQPRAILCTSEHLYSCLPVEGDIQRCISFSDVREVVICRPRNTVAILIPAEYDMLLQANSLDSLERLLFQFPEHVAFTEQDHPISSTGLRLEKPQGFTRAIPATVTITFPRVSLAAARELKTAARKGAGSGDGSDEADLNASGQFRSPPGEAEGARRRGGLRRGGDPLLDSVYDSPSASLRDGSAAAAAALGAAAKAAVPSNWQAVDVEVPPVAAAPPQPDFVNPFVPHTFGHQSKSATLASNSVASPTALKVLASQPQPQPAPTSGRGKLVLRGSVGGSGAELGGAAFPTFSPDEARKYQNPEWSSSWSASSPPRQEQAYRIFGGGSGGGGAGADSPPARASVRVPMATLGSAVVSAHPAGKGVEGGGDSSRTITTGMSTSNGVSPAAAALPSSAQENQLFAAALSQQLRAEQLRTAEMQTHFTEVISGQHQRILTLQSIIANLQDELERLAVENMKLKRPVPEL